MMKRVIVVIDSDGEITVHGPFDTLEEAEAACAGSAWVKKHEVVIAPLRPTLED